MKRFLTFILILFFLAPQSACFGQSEDDVTPLLKWRIQKYRFSKGATAFIVATHAGRIDVVESLLDKGLDPNEKYNEIPIAFIPIYFKQSQILELLLKKGLNPNTSYLGETILYFSISQKTLPCVNALIKYKANITDEVLGDTPLNHSIRKKQPDIVKALYEAGAVQNDKTHKLLSRKKYKDYKAIFEN